jgi:SAM-dependent methyltransferase
MTTPHCRFCGENLEHDLVDLGSTPLANSYVTQEDVARERDKAYPLHARVCSSCFLVQVDAPVSPKDIFSDYAYFSSYSDSWVEHARSFANAMIARFGLSGSSLVVEVASNDGYLLQHFVAAGIPVLGIEPAANVAETARAKNVPTEVAFFGVETAKRLAAQGVAADLTVANNVLAHVPDVGDFVAGFAIILKPEGVASFEFPHILNLIRELQFDTIYHEHFSYLSLVAVERILDACGLRAFDVEELSTHGGSLRLFVCHATARHETTDRLLALRAKEKSARLGELDGYLGFAEKVEGVKRSFLKFLARAKAEGKRVAAYGAAAKGNTFLNVCGVGSKDIVCVFDRSAAKQGRLLPGSHIPIRAPHEIRDVAPDYMVILPWNLRDEISRQMSVIGEWGGKLVTALPTTRIFDP